MSAVQSGDAVRNHPREMFVCPVCGQERPKATSVHPEMVHGPTMELLRREHPEVQAAGLLCRSCLNQYRAAYVRGVLEDDRGEISTLESNVINSLREHELLTHDVNKEFDTALTTGARVADRVASFGGSWRFIIIFGVILAVWIAFNSVQLMRKPFDPFPFILLNLVLSCLASIQAPVIMMSQNRQESKDRLRSEHDYEVNLKAELEIRHLHSKMDQLLSRQWQRLLEIQQIQMELLEEISHRGK